MVIMTFWSVLGENRHVHSVDRSVPFNILTMGETGKKGTTKFYSLDKQPVLNYLIIDINIMQDLTLCSIYDISHKLHSEIRKHFEACINILKLDEFNQNI